MRSRTLLTESNNILDVLKSRYITGFSALWRKASPLAAPRAIAILVAQDNGTDASVSRYIETWFRECKPSKTMSQTKQKLVSLKSKLGHLYRPK